MESSLIVGFCECFVAVELCRDASRFAPLWRDAPRRDPRRGASCHTRANHDADAPCHTFSPLCHKVHSAGLATSITSCRATLYACFTAITRASI